ncbi:MAG: lysine--tRNA ligase [Pyrinomonadaceae bacterium]|nr:lysine--tRNA ligase [Pyrinomonadaceae bacterium]
MGKAAFVHLSDGINRLQIYVRRDDAKAIYNSGQWSVVSGQNEENEPTADHRPPTTIDGWEVFKLLDHGDFVGAEGFLFLTNTGELSVHVETFQFLSKALLPMPDKMHGIADPELRRRYRYADLIASSLQVEHEGLTTREVFERRAKLISGMRRFLDDAGYIEVETPMLTPKATGAAATPFETFHEALGIPLYARIAPELYLKRLTVGGFEKVYELNRNFRNEGLSYKHNPEFTMLEFYCAYMDVNGMMDFAEAMIKESVQKATGGSLQVKYKGVSQKFVLEMDGIILNEAVNIIDFSKFERLTMKEAIARQSGIAKSYITEEISNWLDKGANIRVLSDFLWWIENELYNEVYYFDGGDEPKEKLSKEEADKLIDSKWEEIVKKFAGINLTEIERSKDIVSVFEDFVEEYLIQPTFIIDYPKSISPLSKASPENPQIAERFELFINGMECANGFSELNDPQEQFERFVDQMKEREGGDAEAMVLDEDYIRALSYGMPPAAGIGIGIDRLVMLLTNKHSIRDVILFPHMRPESK